MIRRAVAALLASLVLTGATAHAQQKTKKGTPKPATPRATPAAVVEESIPENPPAGKPSPQSIATVVVFNTADPDSRALARYYATRRGIPENNVVGLTCPTNEEISRDDYDRQIAEPLRKIFEDKGWWKIRRDEAGRPKITATAIHNVALIRGIPLKISLLTRPYPGDSTEGPPQMVTHNEAAVDSELAVLGVFSKRISGGLNNPYFRSYQRIFESGIASLLLVCRLDGPTPGTVRRMIDDSLAAEETGLRGMAYIDARGTQDPSLIEGDKWMLNAATTARRKGLPVLLDTGAGLYPESYPMRHAALYLGWYSENVVGPFVRPDFRFVPGAIAVHLHSFSGRTVRDAHKFWCGPLLAAGAAATIGNVYEPYLGFTPNLDVLTDRLCAGFTFAESAYMSQRLLSWMTTFVGDPLYRPYRRAELGYTDAPSEEWDAYRGGAQVWFEQGPEPGEKALRSAAEQFKSGAILEGLGLLELTAERGEDAAKTFEAASVLYTDPQDILRATIHQVFQLRTLRRTKDAIAIARAAAARFPGVPGADLLRDLANQMAENNATPAPAR